MARRGDRKAMAAKTTGLQRPGVPGETGSRAIPVSAGGGEDPAAFHMSLSFSSSTVHVRPGRQTDRQTNKHTNTQTDTLEERLAPHPSSCSGCEAD